MEISGKPAGQKLTKLIKRGKKAMTLPEVMLWAELRELNIEGVEFVRHQSSPDSAMEFYCPQRNIRISLEGTSSKSTNESSSGNQTLLFREEEILTQKGQVLSQIKSHFSVR